MDRKMSSKKELLGKFIWMKYSFKNIFKKNFQIVRIPKQIIS